MSASDRIAASSDKPLHSFFGGASAGQMAALYDANGDRQAAIRSARRFVRTAPVDPGSTAILGSTLLAAGRVAEANAAFRVAGTLGWRQRQVQLYWLAVSLAVNDIPTAKQRLDALMRLDVENKAIRDALQQLEGTPKGQQALATLLVDNPPWESRFLTNSGALSPDNLPAREATIAAARKQGATIDCAAVANAVFQLLRRNDLHDAKSLWQSACETNTTDAVSNGDFENANLDTRSPFDWRFIDQAGVETSIRRAPTPLTGKALRIKSSLFARQQVAVQVLLLNPGAYILRWKSLTGGNQPDPSIIMRLICNQSADDLIKSDTPIAHDGLESSLRFTVPDNQCSIQSLAIFKGKNGYGQDDTGWIDDVSITRAQ